MMLYKMLKNPDHATVLTKTHLSLKRKLSPRKHPAYSDNSK